MVYCSFEWGLLDVKLACSWLAGALRWLLALALTLALALALTLALTLASRLMRRLLASLAGLHGVLSCLLLLHLPLLLMGVPVKIYVDFTSKESSFCWLCHLLPPRESQRSPLNGSGSAI